MGSSVWQSEKITIKFVLDNVRLLRFQRKFSLKENDFEFNNKKFHFHFFRLIRLGR